MDFKPKYIKQTINWSTGKDSKEILSSLKQFSKTHDLEPMLELRKFLSGRTIDVELKDIT
ncbi:MAG: hypothetical protein AAF316_00205 [Cyanobacteria bacterium P01_A01_bin.80]